MLETALLTKSQIYAKRLELTSDRESCVCGLHTPIIITQPHTVHACVAIGNRGKLQRGIVTRDIDPFRVGHRLSVSAPHHVGERGSVYGNLQ